MSTINNYEYRRTDGKSMNQEFYNKEIDFDKINKELIPYKKVGIVVPVLENLDMTVELIKSVQNNLKNTDFTFSRVNGGGSASSTISITDASRLVESGICEAVLVTSWFSDGDKSGGMFWVIIGRNKRGFARITSSSDEYELSGDDEHGTLLGYKKLLSTFRFMPIKYIVGHMSGGDNDKNELRNYKDMFDDKEFSLISSKSTLGSIGTVDSAIELLETLDKAMSESTKSAGILSVNYGYGGFYNAIHIKTSGM